MDNLILYQDISRSVFEAMNTRNFSKLEKYMADDISFDFPGAGTINGKRKVLIFLNALLRKYPKLTFTVFDIIMDKEKVCIVWTNKGVGIKGESYDNSGMTLLHFSDGKLTFISDYFKDTSFTQPG